MRPKLLVIELWGLGDLAIASPFIRAAQLHYEVTILAKAVAGEIAPALWPGANVREWTAPWTAFKGKYRLWNWPWKELQELRAWSKRENFSAVVSARHDPRDHVLMRFLGVRRRVGVPRLGSGSLLTDTPPAPARLSHRAEWWTAVGRPLGIVPTASSGSSPFPPGMKRGRILIHSGAAQPVRVWPLERYAGVARELARMGYDVRVVCDPGQEGFWFSQTGIVVVKPAGIGGFLSELEEAMAFVGNDSGPGHLAAAAGVPTFTIFGNQLPEWFLPVHPLAGHIPGGACPHKPCFDACRFAEAHCLTGISSDVVLSGIGDFLRRLGASPAKTGQSVG